MIKTVFTFFVFDKKFKGKNILREYNQGKNMWNRVRFHKTAMMNSRRRKFINITLLVTWALYDNLRQLSLCIDYIMFELFTLA